MKLQSHIYKNIIFVLGLLLVASSSVHADLTASAVKARIDKYENKKVTFKIPCVRAIPAGPEEKEGLRFLHAETIDEDNRAHGGSILIVTSADKYNSLIRKYGTSPDRDQRKPELHTIRGVMKVLDYQDSRKHRDMIYLDATSGGVDLSDIAKKKMKEHLGGGGGSSSGGSGMAPGGDKGAHDKHRHKRKHRRGE